MTLSTLKHLFRVTSLVTVTWNMGLATIIARDLEKIWKAKDISRETKLLSFNLSHASKAVLIYNTETWALKSKLRVFEMSVLLKLLAVTRRDRRRIIRELETVRDIVIVQVIQLRRLAYFEHVVRIDITLHGSIQAGHRRRKAQEVD